MKKRFQKKGQKKFKKIYHRKTAWLSDCRKINKKGQRRSELETVKTIGENHETKQGQPK